MLIPFIAIFHYLSGLACKHRKFTGEAQTALTAASCSSSSRTGASDPG